MSNTVKKITVIGMLLAIQVVLGRFVAISLPTVKISFTFLPIVITAMLYGPLWGGAAAVMGDFLIAILGPYGYYPPMAITALLTCGFQSPEFAIAAILTVIVIYDATGVRWEASLHARALNLMIDELDAEAEKNGESNEHRIIRRNLREQIPELNESLGHRPIEACFGSALGIVLALLLHWIYLSC